MILLKEIFCNFLLLTLLLCLQYDFTISYPHTRYKHHMTTMRSVTQNIKSMKSMKTTYSFAHNRNFPCCFLSMIGSSVRKDTYHYYLKGEPNIMMSAFIPNSSRKIHTSGQSKSLLPMKFHHPMSAIKMIHYYSSSTRLHMMSDGNTQTTTFQEGDVVITDIDGKQTKGIIHERKGGWYSIRILESYANTSTLDISNERNANYNNIVKRRVSQISLAKQQESTALSSSKNRDTTQADVEDVAEQISPTSSSSFTSEDLSWTRLGPPTIIDLDAAISCQQTKIDTITNIKDHRYLQQSTHFSKFHKWVVFTDLHCSPSSLDVSLQVLDTVHKSAKERNAGVLFLGDFWHHRGTVRVDCLNAVLNALSEWEVPMIMIPGNHDQVTLGGLEHSITPLQNAYFLQPEWNDDESVIDQRQYIVPGILIFSHPTKFLNALLIPHVRDIGVMQSILQSKVSSESSALFVHADVTGAYMNDLIISTHGVSPAYFPPNVPIYSGHFHKPHIVTQPKAAPGVTIRYVGSPYETTLSEAGQPKALLVLDTHKDWECVEEIPLEIGRKHFRFLDINTFLHENLETVQTSIDDNQQDRINKVKKGDRVVITVNKESIDEIRRNATKSGCLSAFDTKVKELQQIGASVEIREVQSIPNSPMVSDVELEDNLPWLLIEEMRPRNTWSKFLKHEVERGAINDETASVMLKFGDEIIDEMDMDSSENVLSGNDSIQTQLRFESISVQGFGPFKDTITYPLDKRGLVLLRGSNKDGGSDSNGSGKSTLAFSALWALTGNIDPRPVQDSKVADVLNDDSKSARVSIKGKINGDEFTIIRSKTKSKSTLTFLLNDNDLTTQSVKETQMLIDEKLGAGTGILSRTIFHGQHAINGLLESTDTQFKDELSLLVPLSIWQNAASHARAKSRSLSTQASEFSGMISIRTRDIDDVQKKYDLTKMTVARKEQELKVKEYEIEKVMMNINDKFNTFIDLNIDLDNIRENVQEAAKEVELAETLLDKNMSEQHLELSTLRTELDQRVSKLNALKFNTNAYQRQIDRHQHSLTNSEERLKYLKNKWGMAEDMLLEDIDSFIPPSICPTCKQEMTNNHSHENVTIEVKKAITEVFENINTSSASMKEDTEKMSVENTRILVLEKELQNLMSQLQKRETHWNGITINLQKKLQSSRQIYSLKSSELSDALNVLQQMKEKEKMESIYKSEIQRSKDALKVAQDANEQVLSELTTLNLNISDLERKHEQAKVDSKLLATLAENFGTRGVQTFILQNTVNILQISAQSYLDELSDGCLRLNLELDTGDRILRSASVLGKDGDWIERPLSALSGGQWRRCSLALSLGFSDLVAYRGRFASSLLVLDEPLTHLDAQGRENVGKLLRKMLNKQYYTTDRVGIGGFSLSTILIILQDLAAEELAESFDFIDEVVKLNGTSNVLVDGVDDNC